MADEEESEFKKVKLFFNANKAEPLSKTRIPELQKVIPNQEWKDFAEASAAIVKNKYFMMWLLELCLAPGITAQMKALCEETNKKIAQETNKFPGPNVTLEFLRVVGTDEKVYEGGYVHTQDDGSRNSDEFFVVVTYRRAAFFKT